MAGVGCIGIRGETNAPAGGGRGAVPGRDSTRGAALRQSCVTGRIKGAIPIDDDFPVIATNAATWRNHQQPATKLLPLVTPANDDKTTGALTMKDLSGFKRRRLPVAVLVTLAAVSAPALAQEDDVLKEVVVTATRSEAVIDDIPATITAIDRDTLDRRLPRAESDLFRDE